MESEGGTDGLLMKLNADLFAGVEKPMVRKALSTNTRRLKSTTLLKTMNELNNNLQRLRQRKEEARQPTRTSNPILRC
jgi:hypothetical protein